MVSSTGLVETSGIGLVVRVPRLDSNHQSELLQHRNPSNQRPKWIREQAQMEGPEVDPGQT